MKYFAPAFKKNQIQPDRHHDGQISKQLNHSVFYRCARIWQIFCNSFEWYKIVRTAVAQGWNRRSQEILVNQSQIDDKAQSINSPDHFRSDQCGYPQFRLDAEQYLQSESERGPPRGTDRRRWSPSSLFNKLRKGVALTTSEVLWKLIPGSDLSRHLRWGCIND